MYTFFVNVGLSQVYVLVNKNNLRVLTKVKAIFVCVLHMQGTFSLIIEAWHDSTLQEPVTGKS